MASRYSEVYAAWKADPHGFWADAASAIDWFERPARIFEPAGGTYGHWFPDGVTNTCHNCLDRHVEAGRGEQPAFIYDSPVTGRIERISYAELLADVKAMAAIYRKLGVDKGDRIIIYMPMIPQAAIAMLAAARIGAVHSVVFGGFAANELAMRIDDCQAKLVVSASCGLEPGRTVAYKPLLDQAIETARHKPAHCLIYQRDMLAASMIRGRDIDFAEALAQARDAGEEASCTPVASTDPLYVLYTSGTTGQPKGVVRDNGGHMVALKWSMENFFGVNAGDVFWAASDIGWVVGHSYIVYGPLLNGCTSILFEGKPVGTPDPGTYWRVISEHGVAVMFTAPTALRAIRKEDPEAVHAGRYDLSRFRALYLAGERADPDTIRWAERALKVPVIDHWWQTETGWPVAGNPLGLGLLPVKYGSPAVPLPGYDVQVVDDAGHPVETGTLGNVVIKLPLPPGCLPTLWNADHRFHAAYLEEYPGFYKTADAGYLDEDGYIFIMARTDDIINVAGHRLSTGAMEEVCASHPDVAECAVIGIADPLKGQVPAGFLVINANVSRETEEIEKEVIGLVRERIGPVAAFRTAVCVKRLPKTRSGKILRSTIQKIIDRQPWTMPATIDDPSILDEITELLRSKGIGV
ncbi:propionyl-CoA synthetase [Sinorhizobium prairiense]|uniref:propionyl-CoA synthetase n=1 Tax=unclassified Sinorhizobium TaxID=2613772 RepID=UPI0023D848A0|nr:MULTISPECIES: propionyl-CoA synthetase [unclassified Sinorhizobium]WEJ10111.1 propionyl-CoA synthetase [Sinorhizobium sp. M103]WEJ15331.1 propionyl-CoA synthetase [Sinorhizobium sp. K101]WEJ37076.1 propionyl-CoA synthetase [Sinorhizobium sp. C101]